MRRFCTFLIVALLLTCLLGTASADIDLTGMTIEELRELREKVDYAIFEKDGAIILEPGAYVAGKDIAPGSYVLNIRSARSSDIATGKVRVYTSVEAMRSYDSEYDDYWRRSRLAATVDELEKFDEGKYLTMKSDGDYNTYIKAGASFHVTLEEGQVLYTELQSGSMFITIQQAKGLFMD